MSETITMTIQYEAGHSYQEPWVPVADMFCPQCSSKTVWREDNGGDYYVGERYLCLSCESEFTIQGPTPATGWQNEQRLQALKVTA